MSSTFPATIPVRLNDEGRIDSDMPCPTCGYNLRFQREGGACPECGWAIDVEAWVEADQLSLAESHWRSGVQRGGRLLYWGAIAAMPLVVPGLLLATAGIWLLTRHEPGRHEDWRAKSTRLAARMASVGSSGAMVALLVGWWATGRPFTLSAMIMRDAKWVDVLVAAVGASMAVALMEAWRHLFKLAARADGPGVSQMCRRAWQRYLLGVGVVVAISVAVWVTDRADIIVVQRYSQWFAAAALLIVVVIALWLWWTTVRLTHAFARLL